MKYRASIRVDEEGVTDDFMDERDATDKRWRMLEDMEPSSFGGVWVKVEYDDENP